MGRQYILIADDVEVNRVVLDLMFCAEYDILQAANGREAIRYLAEGHDLALVLLDILMPAVDGFGVLDYMEDHGLLKKIPVILITGEAVEDSEERAYAYKIADVIHKPFYPEIVERRAKNIIELYQSKRRMEKRLKAQQEEIWLQERKIQEHSEFMIDALSTVVEFRGQESGEHIKRIKYFSRVLLKYLQKYYPEYKLDQDQINSMVRASALHDIGKIGISDAILLKPGELTEEEFETVKTHTTIGCDILEAFCRKRDEFYQHCYDICRHHHERWDGGGYPDHLKGEQIPLCAQVVAVADVYDALVSERIHKGALVNSVAYDMILSGECGEFAPHVLECFKFAKEDFFNLVDVLKVFDFV